MYKLINNFFFILMLCFGLKLQAQNMLFIPISFYDSSVLSFKTDYDEFSTRIYQQKIMENDLEIELQNANFEFNRERSKIVVSDEYKYLYGNLKIKYKQRYYYFYPIDIALKNQYGKDIHYINIILNDKSFFNFFELQKHSEIKYEKQGELNWDKGLIEYDGAIDNIRTNKQGEKKLFSRYLPSFIIVKYNDLVRYR